MIRSAVLAGMVVVSGMVQTCNPKTIDLEVYEEPQNLMDISEATDSQGNTYRVAYDQVSDSNQDPYIEKLDARGNVVWSMHHSATPVDERAVKIVVDPFDIPWVVFTLDGGSTDAAFITQKHIVNAGTWNNALFRGYGQADGAAQVVVIACMHPETGELERATFFMSRTEEGDIDAAAKTNTLIVDEFEVGNTVNIRVRSWYLPPATTARHANFVFHPQATEATKTGDSWTVDYVLSRGLDTMYEADIVQ